MLLLYAYRPFDSYSSYHLLDIPGAELAQHLSLIAGQVILTDDCEGDWALARLEQNAGTLRTGCEFLRVLPDTFSPSLVFPTRILFPSSPASDVP
jgi:hypothetical protein